MSLKIITIFSFVLTLLNPISGVQKGLNYSTNEFHSPQVTTVVIDAGHGGRDTGCKGSHSIEKDVALKIALRLGKLIKINHPEVEVIYTRTEDKFIPLFRRIEIANENNADLFISIHCNSVSNHEVHGTETFVMGLHRAEENLETAKRENNVILLEQNYEEVYEGFDPNSNEGHIILSLYQNAFLDHSLHFAANVEDALSSHSNVRSRGVKQAGFVVLRRATMPSVLIETGFLSNPDEENFLSKVEGQEKVAQSILKAFTAYKEKIESIELPTLLADGPEKVSERNNQVSGVNNTTESNKNIIYTVQLAAFAHRIEDIPASPFGKVEDLSIIESGELFKYYCGNFDSRSKAEIQRDDLKKQGFAGAFVVTLTK